MHGIADADPYPASGTSADTGIERVDRGNFVGGQLELEDVDVLLDPMCLDRVWRLIDAAGG